MRVVFMSQKQSAMIVALLTTGLTASMKAHKVKKVNAINTILVNNLINQ